MREQHGYGQTTAFCHCGAFTNTPFCDGTHSQVGFQAVERTGGGAGLAAAAPRPLLRRGQRVRGTGLSFRAPIVSAA